MTEKKSILRLASAAALTLAVHGNAWSAPPVDQAVPSMTAPTVTTEPTTTTSPTSAPRTGETPDTGKATAMGSQTTPRTTSKQDTESAWISRYPTRPARTGPMTAEERKVRWEQRIRKMRERATQRRRELQETAERWDSYWKLLDAMTPEQKEAIYAIFNHGHRGSSRCACRGTDHRTFPDRPKPPRWSQPDYDLPGEPFFRRRGYDYGYGPGRAQPYPFERYPGTFFGK